LKIGKRLSQLDAAIKQRYTIIWDCCCDHGFLGMSLLQRNAAKTVYFVDVLKQPMKQLTEKLQQNFPIPDFSWKVFCCDLKSVEIPQQNNQLFIIAGVGGDKIIEFVKSIFSKTKTLQADFLICSVHGNYRVRELFIELGYKLVDETIIQENKRFYELIYVSKNSQNEISNTGSIMWDWSNQEHQEYLDKTISHFEKKAQANPRLFANLLQDYKKLANKP
jgi:tRNA (adenine22-N1)-methyltransferase